jgi:hypothetical protein
MAEINLLKGAVMDKLYLWLLKNTRGISHELQIFTAAAPTAIFRAAVLVWAHNVLPKFIIR